MKEVGWEKKDAWERAVPLLLPTERPGPAHSNTWPHLKPALVHIFSSEVVMILMWKIPMVTTSPLSSFTDVSGSACVNQLHFL